MLHPRSDEVVRVARRQTSPVRGRGRSVQEDFEWEMANHSRSLRSEQSLWKRPIEKVKMQTAKCKVSGLVVGHGLIIELAL